MQLWQHKIYIEKTVLWAFGLYLLFSFTVMQLQTIQYVKK